MTALLPPIEQVQLEELILWARASGVYGHNLMLVPYRHLPISPLAMTLMNEAYEEGRAWYLHGVELRRFLRRFGGDEE